MTGIEVLAVVNVVLCIASLARRDASLSLTTGVIASGLLMTVALLARFRGAALRAGQRRMETRGPRGTG